MLAARLSAGEAASLQAAPHEVEAEELQLFLAVEPLAGVSAAICSLVEIFFERDNGSEKHSLGLPSSDWSPTADDVPKDLPENAGGGAIGDGDQTGTAASSRFSDAMLDAHYLCIVQNPLNLLLQLPAQLLLQALTANLLSSVVQMLLLKLETYAFMGPPTLPGRPAEPFVPDEIVQLQVTAKGLRLYGNCSLFFRW